MVTCVDGVWFWNNLPPMECKKDCDPPPNIDDTIIDCVAPFKHGDECNYECKNGFCPDPDGGTGNMATCEDGVWVWDNPPPIECKKDCDPPPNIDNTIIDCVAPYKHGDECNYECKNGFCPDPDGGTGNKATCEDGVWVWDNPPPIECKKDCGAPPVLDNANQNGCVAPYKHGDECNYHCIAGFCPDPDGGAGDMVTCEDGVWVWDNPPPIECKMDCGPPPVLANTNRGGCVAPYKHGDKCNYHCIAGFCPDPDGGTGNMVTCDDGIWVWNNFPMWIVAHHQCYPTPSEADVSPPTNMGTSVTTIASPGSVRIQTAAPATW
ncbi:PREDICTED: complement factor H-like [Branchiostoma belcheri]|uniref:Complement factor H-like n=1 Tax=Branchiostoma belcheri TaxID=7741 RepID=A0A6P5AM53_BRABE|nr:PREDICTED: complement factor H-like [Branchiostoma belcheri]